MSGIESIGGSGMSPSFLRPMSGPRSQGVSRGAAGMNPQDMESRRGAMLDQIEALAANAGLDSETITALREDLKTAIAGAMEQAKPDGGNADPREAVRGAIRDTLSKYGIDAANLRPNDASAETRVGMGRGTRPSQTGRLEIANLVDLQDESAESSLLKSLLDMLQLIDKEA